MIFLKKIVFWIITTFSIVMLCGCSNTVAIESLGIVIGFGYDIEKESDVKYLNVIEFLTIKKIDEIESNYFVGKGDTIFEAEEDYTTKQVKEFGYGSELIYLISEERAKYDIDNVALGLIRYATDNVNAKIVIVKGKCEDYFSLEPLSGTMSEQLTEMLTHAYKGNFYSKSYTVKDFLFMYYQQGREVYLPYIEIEEGQPVFTGAAIFRKNKMLRKISIEDTKLINILRNSDGNGVISITTEDPLKYIDYDDESKIKVKVSIENDQLIYNISVNVKGKLRNDTIYNQEITKEHIKKLEKQLNKKLTNDLNNIIRKVQKEYRVDCLDLTKYALAKFGRDSGYDSNKYFLNADIRVSVNAKIYENGRIYRSNIETSDENQK